jgi:hypothetical protein
MIAPTNDEHPESGSINDLLAKPIPVHDFQPLSREEIYNRSNSTNRKPGLHRGAFEISDDFDEPLPDSFWLGEE